MHKRPACAVAPLPAGVPQQGRIGEKRGGHLPPPPPSRLWAPRSPAGRSTTAHGGSSGRSAAAGHELEPGQDRGLTCWSMSARTAAWRTRLAWHTQESGCRPRRCFARSMYWVRLRHQGRRHARLAAGEMQEKGCPVLWRHPPPPRVCCVLISFDWNSPCVAGAVPPATARAPDGRVCSRFQRMHQLSPPVHRSGVFGGSPHPHLCFTS